MRLLRFTTALVGLALCLAVAGAALSAASQPTLRARTFAPFSVKGTSFQPSEKVKLTLSGAGVHAASSSALVTRPQASATGAFIDTFKGVSVSRCDGYTVRAKGSLGSVAVLHAKALMCSSRNPG
jgi:hypothetical protein